MPASDRTEGGGTSDRHHAFADDEGFDHRCLPAEMRLSETRASLRTWLDAQTPLVDHDTALLIATELLTNARDASEPDDLVRLRVVSDDRGLEIVVENTGAGFAPTGVMPEPMSPRGRGLAIIDALASSLRVEQSGPMVRVCARLDR